VAHPSEQDDEESKVDPGEGQLPRVNVAPEYARSAPSQGSANSVGIALKVPLLHVIVRFPFVTVKRNSSAKRHEVACENIVLQVPELVPWGGVGGAHLRRQSGAVPFHRVP
jgi:hypothetical protein